MTATEPFDPAKIERPDPALFQYYLLAALLTGPLTPFVLLPLWFRYITLRYHFDDGGVSMKWGVIFRREVYLTYRRIQDIHLTENVLQRWMGLAKITLQTASASSQSDMVIEGVLQAEQLRDFLYSKMRGAVNDAGQAAAGGTNVGTPPISRITGISSVDRTTKVLEDIRDALQKLVAMKKHGGER
jgi:putative membrane protein